MHEHRKGMGMDLPRQFEQTRWSLVAAAASPGRSQDSDRALSELCRLYWYPLYAYLRLRGFPMERAEDLTQGFFLTFIEKGYLEQADPTKGKLRSFLLGCLKNYVANEERKATTLKRGGAAEHHSLDLDWAESRLGEEPSNAATPEAYFDKSWARNVFENSLTKLRELFQQKDDLERFQILKPILLATGERLSQKEIAVDLKVSVPAAKGIIHRFRERFKFLLREEIRETLAEPTEEDIEGELHYLLEVLSA